jgi:hypothetical protein
MATTQLLTEAFIYAAHNPTIAQYKAVYAFLSRKGLSDADVDLLLEQYEVYPA